MNTDGTQTPGTKLLELLKLTQLAELSFVGACEPSAPTRAFGGQVAAQALTAAGRTVEERRVPHSLHSYFVRKGDPRRDIAYHVDVVRDGEAFSSRSVRAVQDDEVILLLDCSFHIGEIGPQHGPAMPAVAPPDDVPGIKEWYQANADRIDPRFVRYWQRHPIELRFVDNPPQIASHHPARPARQLVWMRAPGLDGPPAVVNAAALTYGSDLVVLGTVLLPHRIPGSGPQTFVTSLDHAVWFHAPTDIGRWHLLELDGPVAQHGRGFSTGRVFTESGMCVATVAQEGLIRLLRSGTGRSPFEVVDESSVAS